MPAARRRYIWPDHVQRISGPASLSVFTDVDGTGRDVYLFGDVHFSYKNACGALSLGRSTMSVVDVYLL